MVSVRQVGEWASSLPGVEEQDHFGKRSFRVRKSIFVVIQPDGRTVTIKMNKDERLAYITMAPEVYSVPEGFSHLNFMHVHLSRVDVEEIHELVVKAWRLVAPKKLVTEYEQNELLPPDC